jgi:hypothetical protein
VHDVYLLEIQPFLGGHLSPDLSPRPMRLGGRFSLFEPFLLYSEMPTFSPDFNGLTVKSTVNLREAEAAFCALSHA